MASPIPLKSQACSKHEVPLFSCLGYGAFGKDKVLYENSDLSNLHDIHR